MRFLVTLSLLVSLSACISDEPVGSDPEEVDTELGSETAEALPFVDDCDEDGDKSTADAQVLAVDDGASYDATLCSKDRDTYRIDVPSGKWVSVRIDIDGNGKKDTDLDLYELEGPDREVDLLLDMSSAEGKDDAVWESAVSQPYERLAWYNPGSESMSHFVQVRGYEGAEAGYTLTLQVEKWHDDIRDCDEAFKNTAESGPCNAIMQFPQANEVEEGYVVSHWAHYSNLRREVAYLVRWAAAETEAAFPGTKPIGLLDMGEADGDTPGEMEGQLRHPEGTHINGNDIDIAYYQNGTDNLGRPVCPQNDGYFCTGEATLLDARRTAFFMAMLTSSPQVRVIGVDPKVGEPVVAAGKELRDEGILTANEAERLKSYTTWGEGWPFHHHHMHFSWQWEDGVPLESTAGPVGCLVEDEPRYYRD